VDMKYEVGAEGFIGSMYRGQWVTLGKAFRSPIRVRLLAPIRYYVAGAAVEEVPWGGRNLALAVAASRRRPFHPCTPVSFGMGNGGPRRMPCPRGASPRTAGTRRAEPARMLGRPR
jgi:hypothetical protein